MRFLSVTSNGRYGVVVFLLTAQIIAGEGTWFAWSVLVFGGTISSARSTVCAAKQ